MDCANVTNSKMIGGNVSNLLFFDRYKLTTNDNNDLHNESYSLATSC